MPKNEAKPFLKWAGGKRNLLDTFEKEGFIPREFNRYLEPMVGGGAVFFHIVEKYEPENCIISDVNPDLIDTYKVLKNNLDELIKELKHIKREYEMEDYQEEYYYSMRTYFNTLKLDKNNFDDLKNLKENVRNIENIEGLDKYFKKIKITGEKKMSRKVAIFIFLNKTCYNGLYRVNSSGEFNVPYGRYSNPGIFKERNLKRISKLLRGTVIKNRDFEEVIEEAQENDFIYFDPPYVPISDTSDFTSYARGDFDLNEQMRLAEVFSELATKDCYVMESNSNMFLKNDDEIKNELLLEVKHVYENFNIWPVQASRYISCKADGRKPVEEVVITNYDKDPETRQTTLSVQE